MAQKEANKKQKKGFFRNQASHFLKRNPPLHIKLIRGTMIGILCMPLLLTGLSVYLTGRPLNENEKAEDTALFQDAIDTSKIRIHKSSKMDVILGVMQARGITFGDKMAVLSSAFHDDFSSANKALENYDRLAYVHETAHVWQFQNCFLSTTVGNLEYAFDKATFNSEHIVESMYEYKLSVEKDLLDYNIEQQASIISEYHMLDKYNYEPLFNNNKEVGAERMSLYKQVLENFLENPNYIKDNCTLPTKVFNR